MPTTAFVAFRQTIEMQAPWLKDIGANADYLIASLLAAPKPGSSPYDGRLVEQLLREMAEALDRCLSFRREADDLEVLAVKQALDDKLFLDSQAIEASIDDLSHPVDEPQA